MSGDGVSPFENAEALACLRRDAFEGIGPRDAGGLLFGLGFAEGMFDGLRVTQTFTAGGEASSEPGIAHIPILFRPELGQAPGRLEGRLTCSMEAEGHLRDYPRPELPICFVSSGYASGWYTALRGETIIVSETACVACGDSACHFDVHTLAGLQAAADHRFDRLLPFLDLDAIQRRAEHRVLEELYGSPSEKAAEHDDMMGGFDAMSPAVHVWGPVMVLPYSGPDDCMEALDAVREDVGNSQLRVVVIDTTGSRIDALEFVGLACLLDALERQQLEAVLVGVDADYIENLGSQEVQLKQPITAANISEGIALGFQISLGSR